MRVTAPRPADPAAAGGGTGRLEPGTLCGAVSEQEDPVSRRQFFRGMTGGLFRAIGELSGLDKLVEDEAPKMLSFTEDDVIVPPDVQAANLSQIFSFLEQQADEPEPEPTVTAEPYDVPSYEPQTLAAAELIQDPAPEAEVQAPPEPAEPSEPA